MGSLEHREKKGVAFFVLPLFILSFLTIPTPSYAAPQALSLSDAPVKFLNTLASKLEVPALPHDVIHLDKKSKGSVTKLVLDLNNTSRVYLMSETSQGSTMTLKYVYDDYSYTATLLLSVVPEGQEANFAYYYRYALGPNDSLELILEEGWVNGDSLTPSQHYDYFRGNIQIRSFDRSGQLLKIESSEGFKRILIYTREGKLLTIQDVDPDGETSFYDQIHPNSRNLETPHVNIYKDRLLYTLSTRTKEKRLEKSTSAQDTHLTIKSAKPSDLLFQNLTENFLLWLEAAHPLRAGPLAGVKAL